MGGSNLGRKTGSVASKTRGGLAAGYHWDKDEIAGGRGSNVISQSFGMER